MSDSPKQPPDPNQPPRPTIAPADKPKTPEPPPKAEDWLEITTDSPSGRPTLRLHRADSDEGKPQITPAESDNPWHKRRDLLLTIIPSGLGGALAIFLWLAPPKNPLIIAFGLLAMFCFLAFPAVLGIHYFWRSRLAFVVGILVSALLTGGFGWHVWPATPPPDWRRSDEAKQLASQMASDVQKLEDEGRLIDLTDYHRAIKVRAEWVEKCSVTLGRIDNQMRKFRRETTYRYYFEKSDRDMRRLLSDKNEDRTVLGNVIHVDVLALQAVEKALVVDTSPDLDPNYPGAPLSQIRRDWRLGFCIQGSTMLRISAVYRGIGKGGLCRLFPKCRFNTEFID